MRPGRAPAAARPSAAPAPPAAAARRASKAGQGQGKPSHPNAAQPVLSPLNAGFRRRKEVASGAVFKSATADIIVVAQGHALAILKSAPPTLEGVGDGRPSVGA